MKKVRLIVYPEVSDRAQAILIGHGIAACFVRRGPDGDVIAVPAQDAARARRLLDDLNR
jgi:hypothetical protein